MSWTSKDLPAVGDDDQLWTVVDAASLFADSDLTLAESVAEARALVRLHRIQPVGKRRTSPQGRAGGRYARVYRAIDLIAAYDKLSR